MTFVFLPLYIYPSFGSWQPIVSAAQTHPNLTFMVVINPNNGPGNDTLPDTNYVSGLISLSAYNNVHLLGYVCCQYGQRPIELIEKDVAIYGGWERELARLSTPSQRRSVTLSGIFLDEAPSKTDRIYWMSDVSAHVRNVWAAETSGFSSAGRRSATVIYNPGVIVDESFYPQADYIVAFEQATELYSANFIDDALVGLSDENRAKTIVIVHSYDGLKPRLSDLVGELSDSGVAGLFTTHQAGGVYNEWPKMWNPLVDLVSVNATLLPTMTPMTRTLGL